MMRESSLDEQLDQHRGGSMNLGRDSSLRMLQKDIGTHSLNLNPMFRQANAPSRQATTTGSAPSSSRSVCSRNEQDDDRNAVLPSNPTNNNRDVDTTDNVDIPVEEEEKKEEHVEDGTAMVETTEATDSKPEEKEEDADKIAEGGGNKEEEDKEEAGDKEEKKPGKKAAASTISHQNNHRTAPSPNSHQPRQDYLRQITPTTTETAAATTPSSNTPAYAAPGPTSAANNTATSSSRKAGTSWWERVVVQRSSYVVEDLVEQYTADSVFLQGETFPVAFMDRIEIETGELLGSGTYSNVSQVKRLQLLPDFLTDHPQQLQLRQELYNTIPEAARTHAADTDGVEREDDNTPPTFSTATTGYAIKHLKAELLQNSKLFEAAAADLIMEAKFLSRLSHPNILSLRGMALGGTSTFAATGLFDSYFLVVDELKETLIQRIHRWKVQGSTDQYRSNMILHKLKIAAQVASALAYLHDRRLVFRDLKPHNIGIREDGLIQLFDFGFCRELPPLESSLSPGEVPSSNSGPRCSQGNASNGAASPELVPPITSTNEEDDDERLYCMSGKGTLLYMASEVLHSRCYNQKADVYSWSMVTYELLTLQKPFSVASIEQHKKAVCDRGQRPPLHHLRWLLPGVKELLEHSWQGDVQARWHMEDVKERLGEIILETENCHRSFSKETSFGSHANAAKGFFCQSGEMDDIMLDFTNTVQTRYEYFANKLFCRGNVADVADVGDSTAAVAESQVDTPKASGSDRADEEKKGTARTGPGQETVTGKKTPGTKPDVEERIMAQQGREERKDNATASAAGNISTAIFGQTSQRLPLPETSEQFMGSLAMHSVRLSAVRNRQATASSSYTASTRLAAAARDRHGGHATASMSFTASTRLTASTRIAAAARDRHGGHALASMSFTASNRLAAAAQERHATASMSFGGSTRLASRSLDDARLRMRKSSMATMELEETVEVAGESLESTGTPSQQEGNSELQTIKSEDEGSGTIKGEDESSGAMKSEDHGSGVIKSEDESSGADIILPEPDFFEKSGVLETIKSEDENGLSDVSLQEPDKILVAEPPKPQDPAEEAPPGSSKPSVQESANPQDDTHEKAFVVSTAPV